MRVQSVPHKQRSNPQASNMRASGSQMSANGYGSFDSVQAPGHRQVVDCWIVKGAMDRSTVVGRRDHAAMATPVTSAQVANAWRRAE